MSELKTQRRKARTPRWTRKLEAAEFFSAMLEAAPERGERPEDHPDAEFLHEFACGVPSPTVADHVAGCKFCLDLVRAA